MRELNDVRTTHAVGRSNPTGTGRARRLHHKLGQAGSLTSLVIDRSCAPCAVVGAHDPCREGFSSGDFRTFRHPSPLTPNPSPPRGEGNSGLVMYIAPSADCAARTVCLLAQIMHQNLPLRASKCVVSAHSARSRALPARMGGISARSRPPIRTPFRKSSCAGDMGKKPAHPVGHLTVAAVIDLGRKLSAQKC
jgi:hypothetical protein